MCWKRVTRVIGCVMFLTLRKQGNTGSSKRNERILMTVNSLQKSEPHGHVVQFYDSDDQLLNSNVAHYLCEGLRRGDRLLVIATPERSEAFTSELRRSGADPEAEVRKSRLLFRDARQMLDSFMVGGQPHWGLFESAVGAAVQELRKHGDHAEFRAYGEMVGILWSAGQYSAAIRLEQFWNKLLSRSAFPLFCAYPIDVFSKEFQVAGVDAILCAHTHLLPTRRNGDLKSAIDSAMEDVLGPKVQELAAEDDRPSWAIMPNAESTILRLRNQVPACAEEIIDLARLRYYQPPTALTQEL